MAVKEAVGKPRLAALGAQVVAAKEAVVRL